MAIHAYNTMSRRVDPLEPISPGKMGIYVCGPTVYDDPHLGHARSAVVFDVITRYLRAKGLTVTYVRNITDIDDKIIAKARLLDQDFKSLGRYYIHRYQEAMQRLNVRRPDAEPKATEYIPPIHDFILKLIRKGNAYTSGGNVYFEVESCTQYGRLSHHTLQSMPPDLAPGSDKRHPADFALWKSARPGEPSWPSPWGLGRPGWHIECSAMSAHLLGEAYDIHGGGSDLIFPHHENEIAQSESLFGKAPANCWIHNGLISIEGQKMSKSLGNTLKLHDLFESYRPEALRLFLLSKHYRRPIEFSHAGLRQSCGALSRLYRFFSRNHRVFEPDGEPSDCQGPLWAEFSSAMDEDFNVPLALSKVFEALRLINRAASPALDPREGDSSCSGSRFATEIYFICRDILGLINRTDDGAMSSWRKLENAAQPA